MLKGHQIELENRSSNRRPTHDISKDSTKIIPIDRVDSTDPSEDSLNRCRTLRLIQSAAVAAIKKSVSSGRLSFSRRLPSLPALRSCVDLKVAPSWILHLGFGLLQLRNAIRSGPSSSPRRRRRRSLASTTTSFGSESLLHLNIALSQAPPTLRGRGIVSFFRGYLCHLVEDYESAEADFLVAAKQFRVPGSAFQLARARVCLGKLGEAEVELEQLLLLRRRRRKKSQSRSRSSVDPSRSVMPEEKLLRRVRRLIVESEAAATAASMKMKGHGLILRRYELESNMYLIRHVDVPGEVVMIDAPPEALDFVDQIGTSVAAGTDDEAFWPEDFAKIDLLLTHGHADHCFDAHAFRVKRGATVHGHPSDRKVWFSRGIGRTRRGVVVDPVTLDREFQDGQVLRLLQGRLTLRILHVPGHTMGSCAFLCDELECVFSGDTVFAGCVGRVDFRGGNERLMTKSLRRLLELPGHLRVFGGHYDDDGTTIAEQREIFPEYCAVRRVE